MNRSMQDMEELGMEIHSMSIGASLVMYAGFAVQEKKKGKMGAYRPLGLLLLALGHEADDDEQYAEQHREKADKPDDT